MDYRDINNTNFNDTDFGSTNFGYPIPAAYGGLYQYPFLGQPSRVEGMATQAHETLVDPWSTIPWQGPAAGHSTSLLAATRREPVAEIASLTSELDGYGQLSYTNTSTPMVDRPSQSTYPDYLSQDALLAGRVMALETSSTIPGPSSVPFDYWEEDEKKPSTSTFDWSGSGPTRTGHVSTERFQPYASSSTRSLGYWKAEEAPSTQVPQPIPYADSPTFQPTGGIMPETTADAERKQTTTDKDGVAPPKRARLPNGKGPYRGGRKRAQGDAHELCTRVQRWKKLARFPSQNEGLEYILEIVPIMRPLVYQHPQLAKGDCASQEGSKGAIREKKRRDTDRRHFGELSRYYQLPLGKKAWGRPLLLKKILKDLDNHPHLIEPPPEPTPSISTEGEL